MSMSCSQTDVLGKGFAVDRTRETVKLRLTMMHRRMAGEGERHPESEMCGWTGGSCRYWCGSPWRRRRVSWRRIPCFPSLGPGRPRHRLLHHRRCLRAHCRQGRSRLRAVVTLEAELVYLPLMCLRLAGWQYIAQDNGGSRCSPSSGKDNCTSSVTSLEILPGEWRVCACPDPYMQVSFPLAHRIPHSFLTFVFAQSPNGPSSLPSFYLQHLSSWVAFY